MRRRIYNSVEPPPKPFVKFLTMADLLYHAIWENVLYRCKYTHFYNKMAQNARKKNILPPKDRIEPFSEGI